MDDKQWTEYPSVSVECSITADPSDADDYDPTGEFGFGNVPAGPIAEFVAAVAEGIGDRGVQAMHAIADDDRWGPIYLARLVCSAEVAARVVGGGLLTGTGHSSRAALLITAGISGGHGLPDMVAALRSEGLPAATTVARAMTAEQRFGVLDALSQYVCRFFIAALHGPEMFFTADRR